MDRKTRQRFLLVIKSLHQQAYEQTIKGIVAVDNKTGLVAKDYDFHCSNLITTASLRVNIHKDASSLLFIVDKAEGND